MVILAVVVWSALMVGGCWWYVRRATRSLEARVKGIEAHGITMLMALGALIQAEEAREKDSHAA